MKPKPRTLFGFLRRLTTEFGSALVRLELEDPDAGYTEEVYCTQGFCVDKLVEALSPTGKPDPQMMETRALFEWNERGVLTRVSPLSPATVLDANLIRDR